MTTGFAHPHCTLLFPGYTKILTRRTSKHDIEVRHVFFIYFGDVADIAVARPFLNRRIRAAHNNRQHRAQRILTAYMAMPDDHL